jgi:hypothetical protein
MHPGLSERKQNVNIFWPPKGEVSGKNLGLSFHATGMWQTGESIANVLGSYANPSSNMGPHPLPNGFLLVTETICRGYLLMRPGQMGASHPFQLQSQTPTKERKMKYPTLYRTTQIDGFSIFYREAARRTRLCVGSGLYMP